MESLITHPAFGLTSADQKDDITPVLPWLEVLDIKVVSLHENFVRCPGYDLHTHPHKHSDCTVYPNPGSRWPRLYCHHTSCRPVIVEINEKLAQLAANPASPTRGKRRDAKPFSCPSVADIKRLADELLKHILKDYSWPYQDIVNDNTGGVDLPPSDHHYCIYSLFKPDDVVWTGRDVRHSGFPQYRWRFRTAEEWFNRPRDPDQYICASTFHQGVWSRSDSNVKERKFIVVESDQLNHDETGAIFRWLVSQGHVLRAVVDTAGKSLHGWFNFPTPEEFKVLKAVLPLLGCDRKMFSASQPCRLPGAIRTEGPRAGTRQRLIFLNE